MEETAAREVVVATEGRAAAEVVALPSAFSLSEGVRRRFLETPSPRVAAAAAVKEVAATD